MASQSLQVVDPHMHLWNLQKHHYPWLAEPRDSFMGDYRAIARSYELADFLADTGGIEVLNSRSHRCEP